MYNKDKTVLIYVANSFRDLYLNFDIRHFSIIDSVRTGSLYLGKYVFSSVPILTAEPGNLSEEEIKSKLKEDRKNPLLFLYNKDKSVLYFKGIKEDYLNIGGYTLLIIALKIILIQKYFI